MKTISNAFLNRGDLIKINKVWLYFINSIIKPSNHVSIVRQDRTILLYVLVKCYELSVRKVIEESIIILACAVIRIYNSQGEFESALNSIRGRQNELIKFNARILEWFTNKMVGDKTTEQPQASISEFTPSQGGY